MHASPSPQAALRALADPRRAEGLHRFFKTGPGEYAEGDVFLGVPVPVVRKLVRTYENLAYADIQKLLRTVVHEQRLLALLIVVRRYQRGDERERAALYRLYTRHFRWINNWDLIDVTAEHVVGAHLFERDRAPLFRWAAARSVWPRRIAVMATFHFIKRGDYADTLQLAERLMGDPHDLIHKATGWMLREIGNRDRPVEQAFLDIHAARMPRPMLRYAIEKFSPDERQYFLRAGRDGSS
ncbi:MAG TPA: DNA alkylation repair protein [Kiritimatiellia bacterium]|nr:DNA alkylation repair protein [Kiritimatiellia bacterium]HMP00624.1 DNA alkylation repair protein [Kiritimatiellia bacterium]HMP97681.1 DNA alkylation repair protein [Kiritimatiellia bacterium]